MKALVYRGPKSLVLEEAVRPAVQSQEVLLRVAATGICGSDVHGYLGLTGRRTPPMIMGHEFCGTVEEAGSAVTGFRPGDRVAVQPVVFCGECSFCREGLTNLCTNRRFFGVMDCNGSMAEYLNVPARLLYRMPDSMRPEGGAMVEPLAVAYRAVGKAAGRIEGRTVLVVGAGTIGLLVLAMVKLHRPAKVLVSDLSDRRLELARRIGADATVNPSREAVGKAVAELTGGLGVDVSFEAVGAGPTVEQALAALRPRGTCVWVGNSQRVIPLDMQASVTREISILGSYIYTHAEFGEALGLLARGAVDVGPIISRTVALEQGPELFAALSDPATELVKVVLAS
jgi:2-desacetyl-2-hydroxyethyl bacteriochlorophyllide A dehydrogenase